MTPSPGTPQPLDRLVLTSAFIAAAVAAGLALSLVPNVELVTLVVFASGIALGARGGAQAGASGMILYVLANSALRGFPPPALPLLAAQASGMTLAGAAGGWWRRLWLAGGRARRPALFLLPPLGAALALVYQAAVGLVAAYLFAGEDEAFLGVFLAGLSAGAVQVVSNLVVFALAGPPTALALRRLARERGWWKERRRGATSRNAGLAVAGLIALSPLPAGAAVPPGDGAGEAQRDAAPPPAEAGTPSAPAEETMLLRPIRIRGSALWRSVDADSASEAGAPSFMNGEVLPAQVTAEPTSTALFAPADRWALGWGRSRFAYEGMPLDGPVHAFNDPPDLPLAWRGTWSERLTAAGTRIHLDPPPAPGETPLSRATLTTGSLGRRTTEFALFRNLGPVDVAVDFLDREQQGFSLLSSVDATRLWLRLESTSGKRPDWSLDLSDGTRKHTVFGGGSHAQNTRRLQFSLRGPTLGGETRVGVHLRRQALRPHPAGARQQEVLWDGFTLLGEWAPPGPADALTVRFDRDRRRGLLDQDATLDGVRVGAAREVAWRGWKLALEGEAGHQEPWGGTWEAAAGLRREGGTISWRFSAAHEEGAPPIVDVIDRPVPEPGLAAWLEAVETGDPERVDALRAEGEWRSGPWRVLVGGWVARQENYRVGSAPLWDPASGSGFAPAEAPPAEATILGAWGEVRVPLLLGLHGEGSARAADRALASVPYLPGWRAEGGLHLRRWWFNRSIDLDAAVGGEILGPRRNPAGERYGAATVGWIRLRGRVDNGILTFAIENLGDNLVESSFRLADFTNPALISGRTFVLGLTMVLED